KEIGIRKVYGAPVWRIVTTINRSFTIYTGLALLIAIPLSIWIMQSWLQNFIYRTTIGWLEFAASGMIALVIVWLTISYHAWRAARMNPAEAIRWE
ncbi:MAG: FtsX-like permease family protein, partial [Bacteroidetes bacterium]|nr:FtsX-like permease family protein [Bacteroidota bacterium]